MEKFVGRSSNSQDRFFPPVSSFLYRQVNFSNAEGDSEVQVKLPSFKPSSVAILELAKQDFTHWQLWTGRGLDATGKLSRLLWLHRASLENELNGCWKRADFYWREILRTLMSMQKQTGVWEHLNEQFDFNSKDQSDNSDGIRYRVITELLIDTSCALFNGCLKQSESINPGDRVVTYANRLLELLSLSDIDDSEHWFIAEPLADILIDTYKEHEQSQNAIKVCEDMAHKFPGHWKYQDVIVEIETENAFVELSNGDDTSTDLKDAQRLREAVDSLDNLSKTYPYNPRIYESLGLLNQVRAVKLANGGALSKALLAIEESLAYSPGSSQAIEICEQLYESMRYLKEQVAQVEADIASRPGSSLTAEGERLRNQAKEGSKSADQFIESGRGAAISEAEQQAQAVRLWQLAGLGGADEQIASSAIKLYQALPVLLENSPEDPEALKTLLINVTEDIPEIDAPMRESLGHYLGQHFFHADDTEEETPTQFVEDPPVLEAHKITEVSSKEPAGMWLLSIEALGIKVLSVTALMAMVVSGSMAGWDMYERGLRDQAYTQLLKAVNSGKEQEVLNAAEAFLMAAGYKADARHKQVEELQELARISMNRQQTDAAYEALIAAVRAKDVKQIEARGDHFLSLTVETPNDPRLPHVKQLWEQARDITKREKRDEAYEHLLQVFSQQDLTGVIEAAEVFLALPQSNNYDPRTGQVKKILELAKELPNQWARNTAHSELLTAIQAGEPELVMNAAEAFLLAPPIEIEDKRREQVIDAYSGAFVSWFIAVADPNDASAQKRLMTYKAVIADTGREDWRK